MAARAAAKCAQWSQASLCNNNTKLSCYEKHVRLLHIADD